MSRLSSLIGSRAEQGHRASGQQGFKVAVESD